MVSDKALIRLVGAFLHTDLKPPLYCRGCVEMLKIHYGCELTPCSFSACLFHKLMSSFAEARRDVFLQWHVPRTSTYNVMGRPHFISPALRRLLSDMNDYPVSQN